MKVLWQWVTLFLQPLLLFNYLKINNFCKKPRFASIQAQAAYLLACRTFSNSNAQGYPQE